MDVLLLTLDLYLPFMHRDNFLGNGKAEPVTLSSGMRLIESKEAFKYILSFLL